jgi:hypothetical protein
MTISRKVVFRFLTAGDVIPFGGKVSNPHWIKIHNVKYYLSNDGGPLGTPEDHAEMAGNPNVIMGPDVGKFKYLWVLDTDRKIVVMWRAHDGNEKVWSHANAMSHKIVMLDKKGQINRVTHDVFKLIERAMREAADENERSLRQYITENESDFQKQVNEKTQEYFDEFVAPDIERALDALSKGAIPFGWKPHAPVDLDRQKKSHVVSAVMAKKFTVPIVEAYLKKQGLDVGNSSDSQAAEWAVNDVVYAAYDRYLPERGGA